MKIEGTPEELKLFLGKEQKTKTVYIKEGGKTDSKITPKKIKPKKKQHKKGKNYERALKMLELVKIKPGLTYAELSTELGDSIQQCRNAYAHYKRLFVVSNTNPARVFAKSENDPLKGFKAITSRSFLRGPRLE